MDNIKNVFQTLEKRQSYSEIARLSGVSRNTIRSVRDDPEKTTIRTLRKIFGAMGYELVLSLEKSEEVS